MSVVVRELQIERLREMSAGEKLARLDALFRDARALVEAGVRLRRPDLQSMATRHRALDAVGTFAACIRRMPTISASRSPGKS